MVREQRAKSLDKVRRLRAWVAWGSTRSGSGMKTAVGLIGVVGVVVVVDVVDVVDERGEFVRVGVGVGGAVVVREGLGVSSAFGTFAAAPRLLGVAVTLLLHLCELGV